MSLTAKRWRIAQEAEKDWWKNRKFPDQHQADFHVMNYDRAIALMAGIGSFSENDIALDVGCGPGDFLKSLKVSNGGCKIGLDPLIPYFVKHGLADRTFQAVQALSESMPFKREACTKVFCYNVLDHVANPGRTLAEIHRVMKNGSYLLLALDVHSPLTKLTRVISERLDKGRDIYHPHSFTIKDVNKMVNVLGFQIIQVQLLFSERSQHTIIRSIESLFGMSSRYFLCIVLRKTPSKQQ